MTFFGSLFGSKKNQSTTAADTEEIQQNIIAETSSNDVSIVVRSYTHIQLNIIFVHLVQLALFLIPTLNIQVVIYSKVYCPYCTSTKQLFNTKFPNVQVKVIELDQISNGSTIQRVLAQITGQRTVPNVWVKGKFVGGNDDTQGLFRSGKLSEMLQ